MAKLKSRLDALYPQDRDFAALLGLFETRVMTAWHMGTLFFDSKHQYTKKRLQKIKAAGLIGERRRRVNEPAILFLTPSGLRLLQQKGSLSEFPVPPPASFARRANVSEQTIRHELEVMDVKAAFHAASHKSEKPLNIDFITWPRMYEFEAAESGRGGRERLVKPDGSIRISVQGEFEDTYFLEVDRSTEAQGRLVAKAVCYRQYYFGGGFAVRQGATRDQFKEFPFRVLMVFKTADRRNNAAERLLRVNPPITTQVCLATLKAVTSDPLGRIWIQPKDYRAVVAGTRFDVDRKGWAIEFRPQPERDSLIEARIPKFRLLAES
jgi:hypothetical protein